MAENIEIEVGGETRGRQRGGQPERQMALEDEEKINLEVTDELGQNDEKILADAQKLLAKKDQELAQTRRDLLAAQSTASRATREAQRSGQLGRNARQQAAVTIVESATSEKSSAAQALRAAREAGDIDAELKAQEQLQNAIWRLNEATRDLEAAKGDPTSAAGNVTEDGQGGRQPIAGDTGVSPATQSWIDRHPRFTSDIGYRQVMLKAHADAITDGITVDSPAYFRHLDEQAAVLDSGGGGGGGMDVGKLSGSRPLQGNQQDFGGAPTTRGGSNSGQGGSRVVNSRLGPITVRDRSDGKRILSVPPGLKADFEEGAKVCGMKLADYINDIVEQGDTGLIIGEGHDYR